MLLEALLLPLLFFLHNLPCGGGAVQFRWLPSAALSDPNNWHPPGSVPCIGDNVRLDAAGDEATEQNIKVAHLGGPLQVHKVLLPSNGILYFGTRATEFGTATRAAGWQCEKRAEPKDAIFNAHQNAPNFFDHVNWKILPEGSGQKMPLRASLDAERVPSEEDQVLFPEDTASKVFIDVPARVRSLTMFGQSLSSRQLRRLLGTIEGQFRVRIGADVHIHEHLRFRWPMDDTVLTVVGDDVIGQQRPQTANLFGQPNSNFFEPQFSSLCGFVKCVPVEPFCAEPVQPVGQCCPQCGAVLRFRKNSLNFTLSLAVVDESIRARTQMPNGMGVSLVRIDKDAFHPQYQISVLPDHPANFDESEYCSTMWSVFRKVQQRAINGHLSVEYQPSDSAEFFDLRANCSIQLGIVHWKAVFRALFLVVLLGIVLAIAIYAHYRRSPSFRLYVGNFWTRQHNLSHVTWQRAREGVELIRDVNETEDNSATAFLAEFANRAFSWKLDKKEEEEEAETDVGAHKAHHPVGDVQEEKLF